VLLTDQTVFSLLTLWPGPSGAEWLAHVSTLVGKCAGLERSSDRLPSPSRNRCAGRLEMWWSLRQVERECEVALASLGKPYTVSRAWPPEQSVSGLHSVSATNRLPDFD